MSRLRTIKPGFFRNEDLAETGPFGQLLFAGLWTEADKEGRLEDRPKRLKVALLAYYDVDVDQLLAELADRGFIVRYEVQGVRYIQIVNFDRHQKPHSKEAASTIPPVPGDLAAPTKEVASTDLGDGEHARSSVNGLLSLGSGLLGTPNGGTTYAERTPAVDDGRSNFEDGGTNELGQPPGTSATTRGKQTEVISRIRAAGVKVTFTDRDGAAVKKCDATAEQIAEAYCAGWRGEWGDDWLRQNLSIHLVIERLAGYFSRANGHASPPADSPFAQMGAAS